MKNAVCQFLAKLWGKIVVCFNVIFYFCEVKTKIIGQL